MAKRTMIRPLLLLLAVALCLSLAACGNETQASAIPSIEGEWYAAPITESLFLEASVENRVCHVDYSGGSVEFHPDGLMVNGDNVTYLKPLSLSKNATLYYYMGENGPAGFLTIISGKTAKVLPPQFIGRFLISDGKMTPFSNGEEVGWQIDEAGYKIVDGKLYIMYEGKYMPCETTFLGNDLFYCFLNIDTLETTDGDDLGRPGYCFVRASAIK